jgi:hypothetical protein
VQPDSSLTDEASFCTQLLCLTARGCKSTMRNRPALLSRFGVVVVINLVMILIFLGAGSNEDWKVQNFNAHVEPSLW